MSAVQVVLKVNVGDLVRVVDGGDRVCGVEFDEWVGPGLLREEFVRGQAPLMIVPEVGLYGFCFGE